MLRKQRELVGPDSYRTFALFVDAEPLRYLRRRKPLGLPQDQHLAVARLERVNRSFERTHRFLQDGLGVRSIRTHFSP